MLEMLQKQGNAIDTESLWRDIAPFKHFLGVYWTFIEAV